MIVITWLQTKRGQSGGWRTGKDGDLVSLGVQKSAEWETEALDSLLALLSKEEANPRQAMWRMGKVDRALSPLNPQLPNSFVISHDAGTRIATADRHIIDPHFPHSPYL